MRDREQRRSAPQERDQCRLLRRRVAGLREQHLIAGAPARRGLPHVRDEPDAADNGGRRDRSPVALVVEGDVPGNDRNPQRLGRLRDPLDRLCQLPADLGLLGIAEVEAIRQRQWLAARARNVARRLEHGPGAAGKRVDFADPRTVERDGNAAIAGKQVQNRRVEPGPPHRPRLDELVVLLVDPRLALVICGGNRPPGPLRLRLPLDLVARALVRQERRRNRPLEVAPEEATELACVGDGPDHGVMQLPLVEHRLGLGQPRRLDDPDHALLALGDHDLPGLEIFFAERHPVEVDVDAGAVSGHLGQRRGEACGAAVLERGDEPALDELERRLDQLLARERIADLNGRPLLLGSFTELLAGEDGGAADSVAAGGRPVEDDEVAGSTCTSTR